MKKKMRITFLGIVSTILVIIYTNPIISAEQKSDYAPYFKIKVIDRETGRGIPMVKLTAINNVEYYTDSAGVVAYYEPALMNRDVFFYIESHGYSFETDWLGSTGKALRTDEGSSVTISMVRDNIAQRLYRITGMGIYHDTFLLGEKAPIKAPLRNAGVLGQDSALITPYKGKLFWVWGDTSYASHPVAANYSVTSARSLLPADGGLDPEVGVNLEYFRYNDGTKKMVPLPGNGPYWLGSLLVTKDAQGDEHLIANCVRIEKPMNVAQRYKVEFNDEKEIFEVVANYSLDDPIHPDGHPFTMMEDGREYVVFQNYSRFSRCLNDYDSALDHNSYEAWTCLKEGSIFNNLVNQLDRDANGKLLWGWKKATSPVGEREQTQMIESGFMKPEERWFCLKNPATNEEVNIHSGAIQWNEYRRRWVYITSEILGRSVLGEIWYAEADSPLGPWGYAVKVVTHDQYTFYNPVQHPHFAADGGREIFFEGTYTKAFSGNDVGTPRYNYNQIMYKLELNDQRLALPVPVYRSKEGFPRFAMGAGAWTPEKVDEKFGGREIAFYALDRPNEDAVAIYERRTGATSILSINPPVDMDSSDVRVAFYALPASDDTPTSAPVIALHEFVNKKRGTRVYSTAEKYNRTGFTRTENPICRVWSAPTLFNPFARKE